MDGLRSIPVWVGATFGFGGVCVGFLNLPDGVRVAVGALGVILMLFSACVAAWHYFGMHELSCNSSILGPPQRIPLIQLQDWARKKGWTIDASSSASTNEGYNLLNMLRQAAVDGKVKFWGRVFRPENQIDHGPLISIPSDHFHDHEIDYTFIADHSNYQIFTSIPGHPKMLQSGSIYIDLYVDRAQLRRWINRNSKAAVNKDADRSLQELLRKQ